MRILVVDDEPLARQRLIRLLDGLEGCEVVAEADNGQQAVQQWQQHQTELVLMDIRMPGMDGLAAAQILAQETAPPAIIFCTAYNDYAIEAFEAEAVDYLLKPVTQGKLEKALAKAKRLNQLQLAVLEKTEQTPAHISARTANGVELIPVSEIDYFLADQKYVTVYYRQNEVLIDNPLKELEKQFVGDFIRVHRNALVSITAIRGLERSSEGMRIKLVNVQRGPLVSRRHLPAVRALLDKL